MRQCPLLHETGGVGGKMAFGDLAGFDRNVGFMAAVGGKEMRRRVIDEIHPDGDAVEISDGRHCRGSLVMRGLDPRIHHFPRMDCRVKPGNGEVGLRLPMPFPPVPREQRTRKLIIEKTRDQQHQTVAKQ